MIQTLAKELGRTEEHVRNVVNLIDEGATIPFIARY
ncbi:MAG: Tex-like N-terminal domain-containing protein, partial [Oscillospiraceae bacterium]